LFSAAFNAAWKISPTLFDIWMRLLEAVPFSLLWLLADNQTAQNNLRAAAAAKGVDPARLIFAPKLPSAAHLARHRLADLFLDTLPYNAHTTASDALWAGLPVLTCLGASFDGRVAASLLEALGLGELVASDLNDYEAMARTLAGDADRLEGFADAAGAKPPHQPAFRH
jgi:predicted O-linked N-acetylglucosamine transferase (SPINDLY family)